MSITLPITFNNNNLPDARDLSEIISSDPSMLIWATGDDNYVTKSGSDILTFTDRAGLGGTFAAQGSTTRAAIEDAQIAAFQIAHFESDQSTVYDHYTSSGVTLATDQACTFVVIARFDTVGVSQAVGGRYLSATSRALMQIGSDNYMRMLAKNSSAATSIATSVGEWDLYVGSFDGGNVTKIWKNGVLVTGTTATTGDTGTGNLILGTLQGTTFQAADMDLADFMVFGSDLLSNTDGETFQAIVEFASSVYGIDVA